MCLALHLLMCRMLQQWLNKPDGNKGWASYFLDQGYEVIIVDATTVGRSASRALPPILAGATTEGAQRGFTAPERSRDYYQARFHTQWPGVSIIQKIEFFLNMNSSSIFSRQTGVKGDPAFDAFYASFLPFYITPAQQTINRNAICAVLRQGGPSIFITHSFGSSLGLLAADGCPSLVKGHVSYEGDQSPFASYSGAFGKFPPLPARPYGVAEIPLVYDPPVTDPNQLIKVNTGKLEQKDGLISKYPCIVQANNSTSRPRKLVNIAQSPILFLTGQASIHVTYDQCQVEYLRQARVNVTWTLLEKIGLLGNGHFGMLETNSDAIARYIEKWIRSSIK